jgi:hypothetical protein
LIEKNLSTLRGRWTIQPPGFLDFPNGKLLKTQDFLELLNTFAEGVAASLDAALNVKARENGDRRQTGFATDLVHLPRRCREALDG